jgi:hypothetical protein
MRRVALVLMRIAGWLMPASHAEWTEAMRAELHYLDDRRAVRWAIGCLTTGWSTRMEAVTMDRRAAKRLNVGMSMFFAAAMLLASFLTHSSVVLFGLMAAWSLPAAYLYSCERRAPR